MNYTRTVKPSQIYGIKGIKVPKIPEGYRVAGFRPPVRGESFFAVISERQEIASSAFSADAPRLILEAISAPSALQPFEVTVEMVYGTPNPEIPEGYQEIGFRLPKKDETYLSGNVGMYYKATFDWIAQPVIILEPTTESPTDWWE